MSVIVIPRPNQEIYCLRATELGCMFSSRCLDRERICLFFKAILLHVKGQAFALTMMLDPLRNYEVNLLWSDHICLKMK